ncbi:G-alpha-domain-containing protein [Fomitiporia mediterranea MF3/22]|uniref:G-alpha-domain-containing protein n=1 Tax=Fomitiporia mediterranea (strain MF3/22) TaxID=694068 RepID=UPI0004408D1D|nr:G-alpha-domain-containing protein [Fomitiporia mediterranea MF3/22]EJD01920.1 G-alpha-domain-containing protein [Fomitiporia mediterranea MF3/22]
MGRTRTATITDDDPLVRALAPPPDESPEARAARERDETLAKKRSDEIDARLAAESAAKRKKGQPVKVLLLGQSESGKSTTLKNFQLTYARKAWTAEKEAWRAVIQLNLVRSVNAIAAAVSRELDNGNGSSNASEDENDPGVHISLSIDTDNASILTGPETGDEAESINVNEPKFNLTDAHRTLVAKLTPLRSVQRNLEVKLGSGAEEFGYDHVSVPEPQTTSGPQPVVSFRDITNEPQSTTGPKTPNSSSVASPSALLRARKSQEFFVRSNGWKNALQRFRPRNSRSSRDGGADGDPDSIAIARAAMDMKALWRDKVVREIIRERKVKLLDCADFFLHEIERVASLRYTPSDDDVIRARLRTVGVQEHSLVFDSGPEPGREWLIYDVGGSRSLRAQWPAYFDDVHAIIFLAPINCFDERLVEDVRVNRLDDSMQLWKMVCSNKLLARTELVLFLNKCDLLDRKLKNGVRFGDFVKSYGDGENDAAPVGKFLRAKFMEVCKHYSKEHRGLHVHFTSVIDTQATAKTLAAVQDGILRSNLRHLDLI